MPLYNFSIRRATLSKNTLSSCKWKCPQSSISIRRRATFGVSASQFQFTVVSLCIHSESVWTWQIVELFSLVSLTTSVIYWWGRLWIKGHWYTGCIFGKSDWCCCCLSYSFGYWYLKCVWSCVCLFQRPVNEYAYNVILFTIEHFCLCTKCKGRFFTVTLGLQGHLGLFNFRFSQ